MADTTPKQYSVVPKGWKLVPEEPTPEMVKAAHDSDAAYSLRNFGPGFHLCQSGEDHWSAMLAAAPQCPQPQAQWDASQIKQPGWDHVFAAFVEGAREARANPDATDEDFQRAADGHTKRVFEEVDPASEEALRTGSFACPQPQAKPSPEVAQALEELRYLTRSHTYTNPFGVVLTSHPELGCVDLQERCTEWVDKYARLIDAALSGGAQ